MAKVYIVWALRGGRARPMVSELIADMQSRRDRSEGAVVPFYPFVFCNVIIDATPQVRKKILE